MIAMAPQPAARPSAQTPSSQRPIPLQGRLDLTAERMEFQGTAWWVLKDPVRLTYHRLQGEHYRVLGLLDGKRSLKEIRDELAREYPALPLQLSDVQRMITGLHANGLVWSDRPGQAGLLIARDRQTRRKKFKQFFTNILSCRMPGWDPDTFLELIHPWLRWLYHPVTGAAALLLVLASTLLLAVQFAEFRSRLPEFQQFFGWKNLAWLWVTVGATKVLHEFGHGLTCKHYGSECHEMGVMLLVFSPTLYCDVTDSWMLHNKWQRIWIAAAGMVVEVVLSAVAIITWWFTTPGLLNHLCLNVFFVTTITTVIFNANPLLRYDGYYMLSDWLGIPNLRTKSNKLLRDAFAETCLGLPSQPDPLMPDRGHGWFITYAIATAIYGWIVLSAILLFLYVVLKPYGLQSIGITMAAFSLAGVVGNLAYNIWQIISAPRSESMSTVRTSLTAAVVTAALAAALAVPLPWYIEAPFLIEPHEVEHVFTPVAGQLAEFPVRPGMKVEQGQLLATLRDIEKEDQYRKLQTSREVQIAEAATLHALEKVSEHALALKRLDGIETQMREYESQLAELTIRAPIAGHVVAPPRVPAPKLSTTPHLSEWFGEPSQPQNLGCVLQPRTHLLSLAPDGRVQALIYLDQAHRDDLALDGQVEIRFDHLADRTYKARVVEIARQQSEMAPTALSNKVGGGLDSITDSEGHERLTSVAYQARVVLDEETELLKPGMRGNARFLVERRSAALWLWRLFRRTLHFRI